MNTIGFMVGVALMAVFVAGGLLLLFAVFRFSFISSRRNKGSGERLYRPEVGSVVSSFQVTIGEEVGGKYVKSRGLHHGDLVYVRDGRRLPVSRVIPLTVRDAREWAKITGVKGVPVALDDGKGVFYIPVDGQPGKTPGTVIHSNAGKESVVAGSLGEFIDALKET